MKRIYSLLLAFLLAFTLITPTQVSAVEKTWPGTYNGKVTKIIDGNSFNLRTQDGQDLTIKIAGINSSKNSDALELTKALLLGKNIKVDVLSLSSTYLQPYYYGVVYIDNNDIAKWYLLSGYCNLDYASVPSGNLQVYTNYLNSAKYNKVGIWK